MHVQRSDGAAAPSLGAGRLTSIISEDPRQLQDLTLLACTHRRPRTQRETGSQRAAASAEQRTGSAEQGAAAAAAAACRDQANGRAPMTPRR